MNLSMLQYVLGGGAGSLVGFSLGLVGGGGSVLAVPLIVYLVGVTDAHLAIGTSALAVSANAGVNLLNHTRTGAVKWRIASLFAGAGIVGAFAGSSLGKLVDGQKLLALFALLMIVVAALMLRGRSNNGKPMRNSTPGMPPRRSCWVPHWHAVRVLRHRGRIPDRSRVDLFGTVAYLLRGGIIARCGDGLWINHGIQLRARWLG